MGKKFAPNFANLFLAEWEEKALEKGRLLQPTNQTTNQTTNVRANERKTGGTAAVLILRIEEN